MIDGGTLATSRPWLPATMHQGDGATVTTWLPTIDAGAGRPAPRVGTTPPRGLPRGAPSCSLAPSARAGFRASSSSARLSRIGPGALDADGEPANAAYFGRNAGGALDARGEPGRGSPCVEARDDRQPRAGPHVEAPAAGDDPPGRRRTVTTWLPMIHGTALDAHATARDDARPASWSPRRGPGCRQSDRAPSTAAVDPAAVRLASRPAMIDSRKPAHVEARAAGDDAPGRRRRGENLAADDPRHGPRWPRWTRPRFALRRAPR